jgi:tartrate dehydrogenase/decarboxylase/D-malate dehydrogenase
MMLDHLGHADAAACMLQAIEKVLADPASRTADLGGQANTAQCGSAIVEAIG